MRRTFNRQQGFSLKAVETKIPQDSDGQVYVVRRLLSSSSTLSLASGSATGAALSGDTITLDGPLGEGGSAKVIIREEHSGVGIEYPVTITAAEPTPSPTGPTNVVPPTISGLANVDASLTFDLGLWSGPVEAMEYRLRQVGPNVTLIDWTATSAGFTGTFDAAVGSSLVLDVRATGGGATVTVSSAAFGPMAAATNQIIGAFAVYNSVDYNPTPTGHPFDYTLIAPTPAANPYNAELGYGFVGSNVASSTTAFSTVTKADPRICGRNSGNVTPAQVAFRVDLPEAGTYLIYVGQSAGSTVTPNTGVFEGASGPTVGFANFNPNALTVTAAQVMDATGAVMTIAEWKAASDHGGNPIEVTTTGKVLYIARNTSGGAPMWNCFSIVKKGD